MQSHSSDNDSRTPIVDYIIRFLLGDCHSEAHLVGYTSDVSRFGRYRVVIVPSRFFDEGVYLTSKSLPHLPLQSVEGVPLLFGQPSIRTYGDTIVVDADIVASSFFLLSRYEELVSADKVDIHGRFSATDSLPWRAGFLDRPIVDEYGGLLRSWLRTAGINIPEPPQEFSRVYLTHDVDALGLYRSARSFAGGVYRSLRGGGVGLRSVLWSAIDVRNDPAYTFPWLLRENARVPYAQKIFFFKSEPYPLGGYDRPYYNIGGRDARRLLADVLDDGCSVGLHSSYRSFREPHRIADEARRLARVVCRDVSQHRSHYLTILPPTDGHYYVDAGITDDFTIGYAQVSGFRLGTCRRVSWIDPKTMQIVPIDVHPLTMMDVSLSNAAYMNLSFDEAYRYAYKLMSEVHRHNGELVLLWHNTSLLANDNNYHTALYSRIISDLRHL